MVIKCFKHKQIIKIKSLMKITITNHFNKKNLNLNLHLIPKFRIHTTKQNYQKNIIKKI